MLLYSLPISVVVCTRDRPELLRRCLASLLRLKYPAYEVIVVDSASRGSETAAVVAATPFRYVRETRPGLDRARNRGAAEARHAIIAYTDDDAEADPGWLAAVAAAFADQRIAAMTGLVEPATLDTCAQRLFERYGGMGKGPDARIFRRDTMQTRELLAAHAVGVGANMAFRRRVFEAIGGFDPALDVGTPARGAGDLDMFHRILVAGLWIRYEPAALVRHHHRETIEALREQLTNNGRSFGVYLLKVWREGHLPRLATTLFAARWLGGWLIARLIRRLLGKLDFPIALVWAEFWGALHAPWAYYTTYHIDEAVQ